MTLFNTCSDRITCHICGDVVYLHRAPCAHGKLLVEIKSMLVELLKQKRPKKAAQSKNTPKKAVKK